MKINPSWIPLALAASAVSCSPIGSIPVVGLKNSGNFDILVNKSDFESQLSENISAIDQQLLPRLDKFQASSAWQLDAITVGIGISGEGGSDIFGVEGELGIGITFERQR